MSIDRVAAFAKRLLVLGCQMEHHNATAAIALVTMLLRVSEAIPFLCYGAMQALHSETAASAFPISLPPSPRTLEIPAPSTAA